MKKKYSTLIISISLTTAALFAQQPATPAPVNPASVRDTAIMYPTSFETDEQKMLENWYIKNYTDINAKTGKFKPGKASDEEYIRRLRALPNVIEMPYNSIIKSYIEMYIRKHKLVETMLGMCGYYMPIFEEALEREGLPLELKYLPVIESALNPKAYSRVGAAGLWQFMPRTAKGIGLEVNSLVDERLDPYRSSLMAAKYLKELYSTYQDWNLAIASYNCGPGNVNKAIRRAGGATDFWAIYPFLPAETRGYVPAFIAANYIMTYYQLHDINPALTKRPLIVDTVKVSKRVHLQQISDVLDIPLEEIQSLNPQYRKNVIPGHIRPYNLALPSQQIYCYIMSEDSIVAHNFDKYAVRDRVEPTDYSSASGSNELEVKYHKVRRGENLGNIARRYGVSVNKLKKMNHLKSSRIRVGQRLKIRTYVPVSNKSDKVSKNTSNSQFKSEQVSENRQIQDGPVYHVVKRGESLGKIAHRYHTTISKIQQLNNLKGSNIQAGQKLKITGSVAPSGGSSNGYIKHKVKSGESLGSIAGKYKGVKVSDIKRANNMKNDNIRAGQVLKIPIK